MHRSSSKIKESGNSVSFSHQRQSHKLPGVKFPDIVGKPHGSVRGYGVSNADIELHNLRNGNDFTSIALDGSERISSKKRKNENNINSMFDLKDTVVRQMSDEKTQQLSEMVKVIDSMNRTIRDGLGIKKKCANNISEVDDIKGDYIANYTFHEPNSDERTISGFGYNTAEDESKASSLFQKTKRSFIPKSLTTLALLQPNVQKGPLIHQELETSTNCDNNDQCNDSATPRDSLFFVKSSSEPPLKLMSIVAPLVAIEKCTSPSPTAKSSTSKMPTASKLFDRDIYSAPNSKDFDCRPQPVISLTTSGKSLTSGTVKGDPKTVHSTASRTVNKQQLGIKDTTSDGRVAVVATNKHEPIICITTTLTATGSVAFCPHCRGCVDVGETMKSQNVNEKDDIICPKCQSQWKDEEMEIVKEIEAKESEDFRQAVLEWRNGKSNKDVGSDMSVIPIRQDVSTSSFMTLQVPKVLYFSHLMRCSEERDDWII